MKNQEKIVVLGTGGTIAGTATEAADNIGYTAAQVGVAQLLEAIPGLLALLGGRTLESEQVAQLDSKDMSFEVWQRLALRVRHFLAQDDVRGVVITHGTDTLEETAYFLHAVLSPGEALRKPVVLTCAMRPASALVPDGPQNLMDAMAVVLAPGACGVVAVCAGTLHSGLDVQKVHTYRLDAFSSGEAGPLGFVEEGQVRLLKNWPVHDTHGAPELQNFSTTEKWPRVEIIMNYAGANGAVVDALRMPSDAGPLQGLVVAGTGNGTLHHSLEHALLKAQTAGVKVVRATRCAHGRVLSTASAKLPDSQGLSPVKARIALMLALMG